MADEEDYSKLPLEERLTHKVWKVRQGAYAETIGGFETSRNENDSCFTPYKRSPELLKTFLSDSNVVAQELAVKLVEKYLELGGTPSVSQQFKSVGLVTVLGEKTLASSRKNTKDSAIECILLLVQNSESPDQVVEDLLPLFKHRLPKLVAGSVNSVSRVIEEFGCPIVSPKPIIPHLAKLFAHADRNVRAEATKLVVELHKWMGKSLETLLFDDLKPIQQKDLLKAFEAAKNETPQQKRFTRSQLEAQRLEAERQAAAEAAVAAASASGPEELMESGSNEHLMEIDGPMENQFSAYDMQDPVDVLSKLPGDFESRITSSVWKERKEVLEEVVAILSKAIKLDSHADYSNILRIFARCMKDANIQVVQLAANSIEYIIKGLRDSFQKYYSIVLLPIIERTKEKKASVATALNDALDSIFNATSLTCILDDSISGLQNKTPQVKIASAAYLQRCLAKTTKAPTSSEIDAIMTIGVKLLSDAQEPIRQASTEMIGTLKKIVGPREINMFLEKVDDNRKAKIDKFFESVQVKYNPVDSNQKRTSQSAAAAAAGASSLSSIKPRQSLTPSSMPVKRAATSPVKREDENNKVSSFGRGLTGRSLGTRPPSAIGKGSSNNVYSNSIRTNRIGNNGTGSNGADSTSFTNQEREELIKLREEKQQWLKERQEYLQLLNGFEQQRSFLKEEASQWREKCEQLQREFSSIDSEKDNTILRLTLELENAKLRVKDLEKDKQFLELQVNRQRYQDEYKRSSILQTQKQQEVVQQRKQEQQQLDQDIQNLQNSYVSPIREPSLSSQELSSRVNRLSIDGDKIISKGNTNNFATNKTPDRLSNFSMPSHQEEPPVQKSPFKIGATEDSWKRAAEVTNQLKARIEKMKARSRGQNTPK
ncbi:Microtubule-associated protein, microtubule dynamics during spindle orientation [Scheffersomyces spartinae]|uniref:Microtubule-associated protein, microtubule dynamics during spindle orientation n=1 Tax=Scheffersomyces spartinae TaxID=45513 RepID=A0A9P7VCW4_9ASCO|nr:Microtubule-associated protein, microtubule dynamics during spindle orientation [Scheffersomyces spartinae]KAG7195534.1 Microtubule-associated protein, microtubule dynamics during spindle orientation [Scheffersomyces spartinae]